jgi:hypothetical protein
MKNLIVVVLMIMSFNATAENCYSASISSPSPFMGNDGEIIKLDNGSIFEIKYSYEYMYEYYPSVLICPSSSKLIIKNKKIDIQLLSEGNKQSGNINLIESTISNEFRGLNRGNIYKLANGQLWEQTEAWTWTWTWAGPSVMIYKENGSYKMKVENIDHAVTVRKIK